MAESSPRHEEIYIRLSKQGIGRITSGVFIKNEGRACTKLGTFERTVGGVPAGVTDKKWSYAAAVLLLIGIGSGLFYDPASGGIFRSTGNCDG